MTLPRKLAVKHLYLPELDKVMSHAQICEPTFTAIAMSPISYSVFALFWLKALYLDRQLCDM